MGYETLYFFISITLLLSSVFLLGSMTLYRLTSRSVLGERVTQKHPAYNSMRKFSSNLNIALTGITTLAFVLNLSISLKRLVELNTQDARLVLWTAPIVSIVGLIAVFVDMRKKFKGKR